MEIWSFSWALKNLVAELLMPPGIWVLFTLIALFFFRLTQALQRVIIIMSALMIWVFSTNYFAFQLTQLANQILIWPQPLMIESVPNKSYQMKQIPQVIVILGGGRRQGALDASEDNQNQDVSSVSMERLRFGARLARATAVPVLVTGGAPDKTNASDLSEAELMSRVLNYELGVQVRWVESHSRNTEENAKLSAQILRQENIQVIYLVTHFWHLPRAKDIFQKEGLNVVEAPVGFYQKKFFTPLDFYPSNEGFKRTRWIIREMLSYLWHKIKF